MMRPFLLSALFFFSFVDFKSQLTEKEQELSLSLPAEEMKRLGFFSALYDMAQKRDKPAGEIPKTLHFIWLGKDLLPKRAVSNVKGWVDKHEGWQVKFWTDTGQNPPDDRVQIRGLDLFPLEELKLLFNACEIPEERSRLLRYAILSHEGGVCIDVAAACLQAIDPLQEGYDFFCAMQPLASSVTPSAHLIAATAQHPIIKSAKKWLLSNSSEQALQQGIKEACARSGRKDVVLPPKYFSLSRKDQALFATLPNDQTSDRPAWHWWGFIASGIALGIYGLRKRKKGASG